MGFNVPLRNESMNKMICEMNHIVKCEYEISSKILTVMDAILAITQRSLQMSEVSYM